MKKTVLALTTSMALLGSMTLRAEEHTAPAAAQTEEAAKAAHGDAAATAEKHEDANKQAAHKGKKAKKKKAKKEEANMDASKAEAPKAEPAKEAAGDAAAK